MAIVQISQITNRKGLQIDLPQLAGAEFGWSTDTRQLYIGNGTIEDGAPVIGNTEILTEFSDILNFTTTYTYKGTAAGYTVQTGPTAGTPITNSLQNWLDQFASVGLWCCGRWHHRLHSGNQSCAVSIVLQRSQPTDTS